MSRAAIGSRDSRYTPHGLMMTRRSPEERDELATVLTRLERALDGMRASATVDWTQLDEDLALIDSGLRSHVARAEAPGGVFAEIDQLRPSLLRRIDKFREEHCRLLVQSAGLRSMARAQALSNCEARVLLGELLQAVRLHHEDEIDAVYESINVDIGAGD
jgi:hypothetical protein